MSLQAFAELPPEVANDPLVAPLNPHQREAMLRTEGPVLVLAGAGSGKTRVITHRIAWLLTRMNVPGWQILAMTFTNKSAGEMRERVAHVAGDSAREVWLGTFHSIGVRLLRQLAGWADLKPSFSIYDTDDQLKMVSRAMKALGVSDTNYKPKQFTHFIDRAKNKCLLPTDARLLAEADSQFDRTALKVYAHYEKEMRLADAVDFNDLIMLPLQVLANHPEVCEQVSRRFRYVLVDEFQDTNHAQFELLKLLTSVHGNLCVVGDDDQSIYSWRGAEVGNILGFPDQFHDCAVVKLERNYRSTSNILAASTAVVQVNKGRHGKVLWTESGDGDKLRLHVAMTDRDEADWVAREVEKLRGTFKLSEVAVFYRTNALSRVLEESMRRFRLPYVLIGGQRFYERAEVKDALAWCRLLVNEDDSAGWLRAIVSPKRGIGQVTLDAVGEFAGRKSLSMPQASRELLRTGLAGKATEKLKTFEALVDKLRDGIATLRADKAGAMVLQATGLRDALKKEATQEAEDRLENLGELLSAMADYAETAEDPTLRGFLEQVALVSDTDKIGDGTEKVSLMTMHAAKGLEYDVAFVVGLEEGLLPHANVIGQNGDRHGGDLREVEEERRLLYVAMTRARKKLHLCHARMRRRFGGQEMPSEPSRFLQQVPRELVDIDTGSGGAWRPQQSWSTGQSSWSTGQTSRPANGWSGGSGSGARAGAWALPTRPQPQQDPQHGDDLPVIDRSRDDGDELPAATPGSYGTGSRVRHITFGVGKVLEVDGYGAEARLTVRFDQFGVKKLIARFVKPA
jgi:DNA helicase-2/ATP-dependent DNA helicase PcrA